MAFKEVRSGSSIFRPWDSSENNKSLEGTLSETSSSTSSLLTTDPDNLDSQFQEASVRRKCAEVHPRDLPGMNANPYSFNFSLGDISTSTMQWSRPPTHPVANLRASLPHHSNHDNQSVLSRPELLMQPHPS